VVQVAATVEARQHAEYRSAAQVVSLVPWEHGQNCVTASIWDRPIVQGPGLGLAQ